MSCKDCKFVKKVVNGFDKKESFICNRYPPIPQVINTPHGPSVMCVDPPVQPGGWCGEFIDKELDDLHTASILDSIALS
jgi:hypothetical protein